MNHTLYKCFGALLRQVGGDEDWEAHYVFEVVQRSSLSGLNSGWNEFQPGA